MMASSTKKDDYIETNSGNRVSRASTLCGTQHIHLHGKSSIHQGVVVRGDLANVRIGRRCVILPRTVIRPAWKRQVGKLIFLPSTIGDNVIIEEDCVIQSTWIGSNVRIGKGCIVQARCVIKDCCYLLPGTVLPPDTVVAPFSVYGGAPGEFVEEMPECTPEMYEEVCMRASSLPFDAALLDEDIAVLAS